MKAFIFTFLLASNAFAGADVFCKANNKAVSVMHEDGWYCREELLMQGGEACFVGARAEAINILNELTALDYFEGLDGEYIQDAKFRGKDSISFTRVDEKNDWSEKVSLERCTAAFFKK